MPRPRHLRSISCPECSRVFTGNNNPRLVIVMEDHMRDDHQMYAFLAGDHNTPNGRQTVQYRKLPARSLLALGRRPYTDIRGMFERLVERKVGT